MRVQCDVCERALAGVLCCADEAALCPQCDERVHAANRLSAKHQRVRLLPPDNTKPTCDICQEKSAFFFCLEDRALLCRDCDVSIHLPNSLSASHKRYLLTGTRVALEAIPSDCPAEPLEEMQAVPAQVGGHLPGGNALAASSRLGGPRTAGEGQSYTSLMSESGIGLSGVGVTAGGASGRGGHGGAQLAASSFPSSSRMTPTRGDGNMSLGGGSPFPRRSSFTDFTTEVVPGWRVDELLNIPELADGYTLADIGSSKADVEVASLGDFDWTADLSLFDEQVYAESLHEVPSLPNPNLVVGSSRMQSTTGKNRSRHDTAAVVPDYDDAFLVPDLGLEASPPAPKRRRNYM